MKTFRSLSYLEVTLTRSLENIIITDWYNKDIASDRIINFMSNPPIKMITEVAKEYIRRRLIITNFIFHEWTLKKDHVRHAVSLGLSRSRGGTTIPFSWGPINHKIICQGLTNHKIISLTNRILTDNPTNPLLNQNQWILVLQTCTNYSRSTRQPRFIFKELFNVSENYPLMKHIQALEIQIATPWTHWLLSPLQ